HIALKYGIKVDFHHHLTTVDPPELIQFGRKHHPETIIHRPEKTMWQLIQEKGPPLRSKRYCCELLKEHGGKGRVVAVGLRWYESKSRSKYGMVQTYKGKKLVSPIVDWNDYQLWEYIRQENIPYCALYDESEITRVGCVICPVVNLKKREWEAKRWPKLYEQWRRSIIKSFPNISQKDKDRWNIKTPEDAWNLWWSGEWKDDSDDGQECFRFEEV
ncbi:phosphoadenosine phosphosulfate reductase family protein, partial [Candidatus Pacearchaeota archaeon]|nr:phosphoadenosine phosphosulfate reductase family protein [Candidatus Pacearchaeota archaeon]